jgi:hypothetical protein
LLNVQEDFTMKRSITRWTTTLATAALLGLPIDAAAQTQQPSTPPQQQQPAPPTDPQQPQPAQPQPAQPPAQPQPTEPQPTQPPTQPQPAQPQPTQPPAQPQPTEPQPTTPPATTQQPTASPTASSPDQNVSPEEHLQQARAALSDIKVTSVPARDRAQFNELRRHLSALENPSASRPSGRTTPKGSGTATSASSNSWGTEVAAIDKIITNLAGSDTAGTGTTSTGTTGATGTSGTSRSRGAASTSIDEATRAKLMEIRTHITAYAAAKAGASSPRNDAASTSTGTVPSAAQSGSAMASDTPLSGNPTSGSTAGQSSSSSAQPAQGATTPAQGTATPAQSAPSAQGNTAGAQDPTAQPGAAAAAAAPKVDTEAAHRSLLAARDALNQLTQLPAAAQLAGETRTQVQKLISDFNELVTNTTDWRTSYAKVSASLASLLGPETGDTQAAATTPAPATPGTPAPATAGGAGTAGAVGTSGSASVQLDPAIRAKLVEMRTHLNEFEKASGGMQK